METPVRGLPGVVFGYIQLGELSRLEETHAHVHGQLPLEVFEDLKACPGSYDGFPVFFYLRNDANVLLSSVHYYPDRFHGRTSTIKWGWRGSSFTHVDHRRKGLATLLYREAIQVLRRQGVGSGATFSTEVSMRIHRKMGAYTSYAPRRLLVRNLKPFLKAHLGSDLVASLLAKVANPLASAFYSSVTTARFTGQRRYRISEVRSPEQMDALSRSDVLFSYQFESGIETILWKTAVLNKQDNCEAKIFLLEDPAGSDVVGYLVLKEKYQENPVAGRYAGFRLMTLMDFGLFRAGDEDLKGLTRAVLEQFIKSDADVLEVISNSRALNGVLSGCFLPRVGKGMSFSLLFPAGSGFLPTDQNVELIKLNHSSGDGFSF